MDPSEATVFLSRIVTASAAAVDAGNTARPFRVEFEIEPRTAVWDDSGRNSNLPELVLALVVFKTRS
jgi:hypothetical protein